MIRRLWQTLLLSLVLGLGSLWLVLPGAFSPATLRATRLEPAPLLLLIALLVAWWLLSGWRIRLLARTSGSPLSLWRGVQTHLLGAFSSVVTPSGGGNSLGVAWLLTRFGLPLQNAAAVSVLLIVLDMAFFAWSVPVAFLYLVSHGTALPGEHLGLVVAVFSVVVLSLSYLLTFRLDTFTRLLKRLFALRPLRRFEARSSRFLDELELACRRFATMPWQLHLGMHALSALIRLAYFGLLNLALAAVGLDLMHLGIVALQALVHAFAFLVPTPGASGYQEAVISWALKRQAPAEELSVGVLLWRLTNFYLYFLIGPFIGGMALLRRSGPEVPRPDGGLESSRDQCEVRALTGVSGSLIDGDPAQEPAQPAKVGPRDEGGQG